MRIIIIFLLLTVIGTVSMHSQTKTFDIKYVPVLEDDPNDISNFQQISPTRTLAFCGGGDNRFLFIALNSDGMIEHRWKMPFMIYTPSFFYKYDLQSNTLVFLVTELISTASPIKLRQRLVLLDSNLVEKKNIILDSTITGIATVFDRGIYFQGCTLLDSTILWMSYRYTKTRTEQIVLHISKDGRILGKTSIMDTNSYITHYPLFQMPTSEILFESSTYNPKIDKYILSLRTSDTAFHFATKLLIDSLYNGSKTKYIPTRDGGIALAYYRGRGVVIDNGCTIVKYDRNFKKQWTAFVPGGDLNTNLSLVESRNGGYYIVTTGYDTDYTNQHPEFKNYPDCFQDIVLSRIDTSGKVLFNAYYGTGTCNEAPYGMMQDYTDGGIIISGSYNRPRYNSPCESLCNDVFTYWLFKVDSLGEPAKRIGVTGVEEKTGTTNTIQLFPNPASGMLTVEYGRTNYYTSIEIIDTRGAILQSSPLEATANKTRIEISSIAPGNYFCRLRSRSFFIARPFVIQR
jgi:hypothetical protein